MSEIKSEVVKNDYLEIILSDLKELKRSILSSESLSSEDKDKNCLW